jgi:uncharacterized membrane protein YphA (DoxX/SURF4 family)
VTDYAALLRELAIPRLVGTPNHQIVRAILKRELAARGFAVEEHAFTARPSPILFGAPSPVHGVNLIAARPSGRPAVRPSVWLTAHYDSKGQPISMALRLAGAAALVAGLLTVFFEPPAGAILLVVGLLVFLGNRVTNRSAGAVDNASSLVAVLMAVDLLDERSTVGVVFPDAEELGLVGARALVADAHHHFRGTAVFNFDGLDDIGRPTAVLHRPGPLGRALADALGARRARWMPVLVDGIALAGAAAECVTIMKGDWRTTRIVHTPRDTADRLNLAGARAVAQGVARVLATA